MREGANFHLAAAAATGQLLASAPRNMQAIGKHRWRWRRRRRRRDKPASVSGSRLAASLTEPASLGRRLPTMHVIKSAAAATNKSRRQ